MEVFKAHIYHYQEPGVEGRGKDIDKVDSVSVVFSERLPTLKQVEQILVDEAMQRAEGNQSVAAMNLGISRQALNKRLKKTNP